MQSIECRDLRDFLRETPDKSCRLAFADPPYWVDFKYDGTSDLKMDRIEPDYLVNELARVSEVACITPGAGNEYDYPRPIWKIIWYKPGSSGRSKLGGFCIWEPVFVYGSPKKRFWNDLITAQGGREFDRAWHPCPKPLSLMIQLVEGFTDPGDMVIDVFSGSGTTAKACKILGRNFRGCELNPEYVSKSLEMLRQTEIPLLQTPEQKGLFE